MIDLHPAAPVCRFCGTPLRYVFADLGMTPLANAYLKPEQLNCMEPFYPLRAYVCEQCFLVQLEAVESPEAIFSDYAYFSSYSTTWLEHARRYVDQITERLCLDAQTQVVEVASNDGYLLQYFLAKGIPVLGVEPAANVAQAAVHKGIPTRVRFFGRAAAEALVAEGIQADLLIGNNVLAHVPDLNDFVAGMNTLLGPRGVVTLEFPHLLRLMVEDQFDTIYHEHFSYFSFITVCKVFAQHGLTVFDVEELPTHGGSLRVYACRASAGARPTGPRVANLIAREAAAGLVQLDTYLAFAERVKALKLKLLSFLVSARSAGKTITCYGAAAKGNTLLNYVGVRSDMIEYAVDRSPHKQGLYLPGTHIPIYAPEKVAETRPDYLVILPWNLKDEIMAQMAHIRSWGGRFVVLIPEVTIIP